MKGTKVMPLALLAPSAKERLTLRGPNLFQIPGWLCAISLVCVIRARECLSFYNLSLYLAHLEALGALFNRSFIGLTYKALHVFNWVSSSPSTRSLGFLCQLPRVLNGILDTRGRLNKDPVERIEMIVI